MEDILAGKTDNEFNVNSRSRNPNAKLLSALANRPFEIDGQMFSSIEGFYQGIRFPPDDRRRLRAFASSYGYAQQFRREGSKEFVWWQDKQIPYGSAEHKALIELAFRADFDQNPDRLEALKRTKGLRIRHETGEEDEPDSPFTKEEFCTLLTKIREEALALER